MQQGLLHVQSQQQIHSFKVCFNLGNPECACSSPLLPCLPPPLLPCLPPAPQPAARRVQHLSRLKLKSGSHENGRARAMDQADTGPQTLTKCMQVPVCVVRLNPRGINNLSFLVLKASNVNAKLILKLKPKYKQKNRKFQKIHHSQRARQEMDQAEHLY